MSYDGSPEHLTWDGLDESEAKELKSRAENAPPSPALGGGWRFSLAASVAPHIPCK